MKESATNFWLQRRKELEREAGETISQFDMAVRIGVTPSAVNGWERDVACPRLSAAPKLAAGYGVSVERIEAEIVAMARRISRATKSTAAH